ncbi:MAG: fibrobacter succinogenes major paralogous domain-containing protein [Bacteroidetes bacterium]|nr:fibrobacter succinogenes major paralogous domain-containing protein [Bacteroidota bacterium]
MRYLMMLLALFVSVTAGAQNCVDVPDSVFTCLEEEFILSSGVQSGTFFDGSDDFILMESPAIIGTLPFSVSFDAMTDFNGAMDVFTQSCGTDCWADIRCGFNTPQCGLEGASFKSPSHFATWPIDINDEHWHRYTFVFGQNNNFSFSNIQVYVDGMNILSYESLDTFCGHNWGGWTYNPESNPVRLGKGDPLGGFFKGYLRNVGIWHTALDASYIQDSLLEIDLSDSTLISFWPLEGIEEGYFMDAKGSNHGLPMGGVGEDPSEVTGEVEWFNGSNMPNQELYTNESGNYTFTVTLPDGQICEDSIWVEVESSPYTDLNNNGICDHLDGSGCLDPSACNYEPVQSDSIPCIFPVYGNDCNEGSFICAEGTYWDAFTQSCLPSQINPILDPAACGPGTTWNEELYQCFPIESCPQDIDGDGVIGIDDLMELLSVYATECIVNEEPDTSSWTCGDLVNYNDYSYQTVLIGEQCWFAENLRTEFYQNGDSIPGNLDDNAWSATSEGVQAVFGEGNSECIVGGGYSDPNQYFFDVCDENMSLDEFGRLYNSYAIMDVRGVCPSGWKVAANQEWNVLEGYLSSEGFNGMESEVLKSASGWNEDVSGTDVYGFKALPGGQRTAEGFSYAGGFGRIFSSTSSYPSAYRDFQENGSMPTYVASSNDGLSARCVKD